MTQYSRINIVYRLQKWMDSVPGQTFLNYAYSWGAAVVILGTLFKLTHIPGANAMLFIGMGTEVFVFFLSAFDRPFDKTAEGRELPTHLEDEDLLAPSETAAQSSAPLFVNAQGAVHSAPAAAASVQPSVAESHQPVAASDQPFVAASDRPTAVESAATLSGQPVVAPSFVPQMTAEQAAQLNEAQGSYLEELQKLVETLGKVNEQSTRLTRDSEEMENLNRTLTGITKIYEMQLKGASAQVGTIDQINEQTRKMAQQIEQLNNIYARMIQAMTVNMQNINP